MLNLAIVGLGSIAQKAYLPFMRQLPDIHWHLFTRQSKMLQETAALFGQADFYESLEDLAALKLDGVFIHTATSAHFSTAKCFLERGIPVYMDKPLAESYEETKALYQLADQRGAFLMAGFNRRFAPKVLKMAEQAGKRKIYVAKNDVAHPGDMRFKLFDFFIHPLDTALFLADESPTGGYYHYHRKGKLLSQVTTVLETAHSTIIATMNLESGSRREVMEVETAAATFHLENLDCLTIYQNNQEIRDSFSSWDRTLYKRGFETAVLRFLEAIDSSVNPVSMQSSLLSHWICQQIYQSQATSGILKFNR